MTDLEIQIAFDGLAEALKLRGYDADKIEEYLTLESQRVAQEMRDEAA